MLILGIESSCDETAAAIYETDGPGGRLKSSVVASQLDLHAKFGGVVPELSARAHVERMPGVVSESLSRAEIKMSEINAVAVTHRPGLLSALLCGVSYARGLAIGLGVPLYGVDHVKAHVAAAFLDSASTSSSRPLSLSDLPVLAMVASGGHTVLLTMKSPVEFELIGTTRDDAVGEAFDKVGQLLGLPFPGGPHVEKKSAGGNSEAFRFPIGVIRKAPFDFSFSGLKTAVLYTLAKMSPEDRVARASDIAASFQSAAIRALVSRAVRAVRTFGIRRFVLCGGVAANRTLRTAMNSALVAEGAEFHVPPFAFCGDTAAQVAVGAAHMIAAGAPPAPPDLDADTISELFASSR